MEDLMSTPLFDLPAGEYLWTNAGVLAAEVRISPAAASAWLPERLRLPEPATATLFVADYPETRFGSVYREAAVLLHAADENGPVMHCPWMVVDDDTALILGRELLGFPKKLAEIRLERRNGGILGTVTRRGVEVLRIEARLGGKETTPAPLFARRMVNVIGTLPTGMKLIELSPTEERIHFSRIAEAKVTLASSERDPLGDLRPAPEATARFVELDFGGGGGGPGMELLGDVEAAWVGRRFFGRAL